MSQFNLNSFVREYLTGSVLLQQTVPTMVTVWTGIYDKPEGYHPVAGDDHMVSRSEGTVDTLVYRYPSWSLRNPEYLLVVRVNTGGTSYYYELGYSSWERLAVAKMYIYSWMDLLVE